MRRWYVGLDRGCDGGWGWEIGGIRSTMEVGWMEGGRDGW